MSDRTNSIPHFESRSSDAVDTPNPSWWLILCFSIPGILLAGSYFHMCLFYKKLWLFDTVVHENGKYTLLEVIFYFRHFCWEIPGKVLYSIFIVGAFYYYGKPLAGGNGQAASDSSKSRIIYSGLVFLVMILVAIIMTAHKFGYKEAINGLFQYRASELRPAEFGSHWRNHFLSNIVLFSASAFLVLLHRIVNGNGYWTKRKFAVLLPLACLIFIFFTFFFGLTKDPFETPSYLGHQLREIFGTDLPITMLLSIGTLIYLEKKYDPTETESRFRKKQIPSKNLVYLLCWLIPVISISTFLVIKVLSLDIAANIGKLGGTRGWSVFDLFAWHFFEHSLDYLLVVCLVYFLYLSALRLDLKKAVY